MTTGEWLSATAKQFTDAAIGTARLDALVLLADELQIDKSTLLAYPDRILQGSELEILNTKVMQRVKHIPLAYVRGKAEFYGREFIVNEYVLVPRPETEAIIELLKRQTTNDKRQTIFDIGTGSGCLAVTAKLEVPLANVYAVDIDPACLEVAEQNATKLHADITLLQGDLLQPIRDLRLETQDSIILANLPYVPSRYQVNQAALHEPVLALYGGDDGLDAYRSLFEFESKLTAQRRAIITESLPAQHTVLQKLAASAGYQLDHTDGFVQLFIPSV